MILIFTTIQEKALAKKIGIQLLKKRLIACFSLYPVESAFWWKGKITSNKEILMILKTKKENFVKIELALTRLSGYETPEIVAIIPSEVNTPYLNWIDSETK